MKGRTVFGGKNNWLAVAFTSLTLVLAIALPSSAQGRRGQAPRAGAGFGRFNQGGQHHAGDWLRRYKDLPPDQQERALEKDPQFRKLPAERQQKLRERLHRFSSLPPEQQQRILNRMETWEHLTPVQKLQVRQLFARIRQLPPERRRMVQSAIRDLRTMPPEQRQQVINSDRFKSQFSSDERDLLTGVTQLPLAPADNDHSEETPDN